MRLWPFAPSGTTASKRQSTPGQRLAARASLLLLLSLVLALAAGSAGYAGQAAPASARASEAAATAVLDQLVEALWSHSDDYFHAGDYETASRLNRLVIRLDPHFVEGIGTLAWLLRQGLNRPDEALSLYHRGLRDNPERYDIFFEVGMFYFDRKEYPLAVHYLGEAVKREPPPPVYHLLAHSYEKQGNLAEALRVWRETTQKFPNDQVGRRNLERVEEAAKPH